MKNKNKRRIVARKAYVSMLLLGLSILYANHAQAASVSVEDINSVINIQDKNALQKFLADAVLHEMDRNGIKSTVNGINILSGRYYSKNGDCAPQKHEADINYSLNLNNASKIIFDLNSISSLGDIITAYVILDGQINISGYAEAKPSQKSITCIQYTSYKQNVVNTLNADIIAEFKINLNPRYVSASTSISGKSEVSFSPKATVSVRLVKYDSNIDASGELDLIKNLIDVSQAINAIRNTIDFINTVTTTGSSSGEPVTMVVSFIGGLIANTILDEIGDKLDDMIADTMDTVLVNGFTAALQIFAAKFSGNGYVIDITNQISPLSNIILPSENDIKSYVLPSILLNNKAFPIVCMDAEKNPGQSLYDFIVNDKVNADKYIEQANQCGAAVIGAVQNLL